MNDLYGFNADNFIGQLPAVLFDDARMNALAHAIAKALAARLDELPLAEIYTRIDALPEALLDILARDFSIDWYNYDSPTGAKRNLIKSNYYVHRHLGTSGAVKSAVLAAFAQSSIEEWFEYNGKPYHFRVRVGTHGSFSLQQFSELLRIIEWSKRHSAHLESVTVEADPIETPLRLGAVAAQHTRIPPALQPDAPPAPHNLHTGGRVASYATIPPIPQPDSTPAAHTLHTGGRAMAAARVPPAPQPDAPPRPDALRPSGAGAVFSVLRGRVI